MDLETKKTIAAQLQKIEARNNGRLTPDAVVADAKNKRSPLHTLFEWNNDVAAHQWRLDQARELIRSVKIELRHDTKIVTPRYVRDPIASGNEQGYVDVTKIRSHTEQAQLVLLTEFDRVAALLTRARGVAETLGLEVELENLIAGITTLRERIATAA